MSRPKRSSYITSWMKGHWWVNKTFGWVPDRHPTIAGLGASSNKSYRTMNQLLRDIHKYNRNQDWGYAVMYRKKRGWREKWGR